MALKDVFQQFLNDMEWTDEIKHDDRDDTDFINMGFGIDGQSYRLVVVTDELRQVFWLSLFSPIRVPKSRAKEAAFVLNFLNAHMRVGNLEMGENGSVYYRWAIVVEGATASSMQFHIMVKAAGNVFDERTATAIGAAAFSKESAEDIIEDYKADLKKLFEESDEMPTSH